MSSTLARLHVSNVTVPLLHHQQHRLQALHAKARCFSRSTPLSAPAFFGRQLHRRARASEKFRCEAKKDDADEDADDVEQDDEEDDSLDKQERLLLSWKSAIRGLGPKEKAPDPMDDPDMKRRVQDNKRWNRSMSPNDAWDVDKELDAVSYKRSALESLLRADEEADSTAAGSAAPVSRPLRCVCCNAIITDENQISKKAKQHEHPRMTAEGAMQVFRVFSGAKGVVADETGPVSQAWLFPPRTAVRVSCADCKADVGYAVSDDPREKIGAFFALRSNAVKRDTKDTLPDA